MVSHNIIQVYSEDYRAGIDYKTPKVFSRAIIIISVVEIMI